MKDLVRSPTQEKILSIIGDGKPKSSREIKSSSGLSKKSVENALSRMWKSGLVLRTEKPIREQERVFKGRSGVKLHVRSYHKYLMGSVDLEDVFQES